MKVIIIMLLHNMHNLLLYTSALHNRINLVKDLHLRMHDMYSH